MLSDVGISESTPFPFPLLSVSWFQLPFEAAYQKQNRHRPTEVLTAQLKEEEEMRALEAERIQRCLLPILAQANDE